jgi:PST family polysaccharide transporter
MAKFKVKIGFPSKQDIRTQLRDSRQYFAATVSSSVSSSFNTLVLGFTVSSQVVGYYAAAEKLFIAMRASFYPITQALYPYMSKRRDLSIFKKVSLMTISAALIGAAVVFFFSDSISNFVLGAEFTSAIPLLQLFTVSIPIIAVSLLISYPYLAAFGYERSANYPLVIGALLHMAIAVALLPKITPLKLISVLIATETIVLVMRLVGVYRARLWPFSRSA